MGNVFSKLKHVETKGYEVSKSKETSSNSLKKYVFNVSQNCFKHRLISLRWTQTTIHTKVVALLTISHDQDHSLNLSLVYSKQ